MKHCATKEITMINKMLRINNLTGSDEILNNFFLKNINRIAYMTIYDISKNTYISTSTIVRYCKKLGASGYKDFKLKLMNSQINSHQTRFNNLVSLQQENISLIDLINNLCVQSTEGLHSLTYSLNATTLNKIAALLLKSKKIYGIGVGDSFIKLQELQFKLLKLGVSIELINFQSEQFYLAYYSTPHDVALIISYSGTTAEIINDSKVLNANQTPIIAITANENSYLAQNAKIFLKIPKMKSEHEFESELPADICTPFITTSIYLSVLKQLNIKQLTSTPIMKLADKDI
jgi:SIS domain protein